MICRLSVMRAFFRGPKLYKAKGVHMNIILIGMPTSGKSTVGVVLAKILGMDFLDTDLLIQRETGRRLNEIIDARGIEGFLQIEESVCAALHADNTVIATGGSVVFGRAAMEHLKKTGKTVYLKISLTELKERLQDAKARGVILRDGESIEELYAEREALYSRYADEVVSEEGLTLEQTVHAVRKRVLPSEDLPKA